MWDERKLSAAASRRAIAARVLLSRNRDRPGLLAVMSRGCALRRSARLCLAEYGAFHMRGVEGNDLIVAQTGDHLGVARVQAVGAAAVLAQTVRLARDQGHAQRSREWWHR
ncbi:hypothetical protein DK389_16385 [Methylobacterium durans]|uniref:Uncharacterized protein n=1 Tax=Methylobacterium durans TaxID=2202825 RepID=A0A2U8W8Z6_9HYPH|nr:hypothetical protein DK389_16385 [Methylobacterium durans]